MLNRSSFIKARNAFLAFIVFISVCNAQTERDFSFGINAKPNLAFSHNTIKKNPYVSRPALGIGIGTYLQLAGGHPQALSYRLEIDYILKRFYVIDKSTNAKFLSTGAYPTVKLTSSKLFKIKDNLYIEPELGASIDFFKIDGIFIATAVDSSFMTTNITYAKQTICIAFELGIRKSLEKKLQFSFFYNQGLVINEITTITVNREILINNQSKGTFAGVILRYKLKL